MDMELKDAFILMRKVLPSHCADIALKELLDKGCLTLPISMTA